MIIHNPILTGSFTVNGTNVASITSSADSITALNNYTASQNTLNGTYATTSSNTFTGIQTVNSNLVVTGSITAQTLVVQTITSSVDFVTGSTRFGSILSNTHVFSGSVTMNPSGLFVSSSGNVGIGTTTPARKLSVIGAIGFYNNTGANDSQLLQYNDGALSVIASTYGNTGIYTPIVFKTTDSEVMRITTAGVVGIGTSSPTALGGGYGTLDIRGTTGGGIAMGNSTNTGYIYTDTALRLQSGNIPITFLPNGTEQMRITTAGNVGIGTSSVSDWAGGTENALQVKQSSIYSYGGYEMGMQVNAYYNAGWKYIGSNTSTQLQLSDGSFIFRNAGAGTAGNIISYTERMRLTSVGLAIGTSTPYAALQVNGNIHRQFTGTGTSGSPISEEGFVYSEQSNSTALAGMWFENNFQSASGVNVIFKSRSNGGTVAERMRISNNDYGSLIAIGTSTPTNGGSAASWLTLNGTTAGSYSGGLAFAYDSAAKVYQFFDNNNFYVQNGALGVYLARDGSSWSSVSDERLKNITSNIDNAVEKLMTLRTVNFSWKSDNTNKENLGLIAQDVEKVFPQVIDKTKLSIGINSNTDNNEYLGVRYQDLVPVLIAAIQEQQQQIEELKSLINK